MTVSTTDRIFATAGNGATTAFAFSAPYRAASDLKVYLRDNTTLAMTLQTENTHYTVAGTSDTGTGGFSSGTINFVSPPASTKTVVRIRQTPLTQSSFDPTSGAALGSANVEGAMDRLTQQVQDQALGLLKGEATIDFASVAAGAISSASNVTVTGAAVGDHVLSVTASGDIAATDGVFLEAKVTSSNTVEVTLRNDSASTFDAASQTIFVLVLPKANIGQ